MKLLLQAGIHLIKKVITFVIYGRSVQVFKACTLFYFFSAEFFFSQIFLRERVLAHRFHRYTQIFFIMIFLHRISRMNRRHSCLSDYSRIFAELWPLANGSRPIYAPVVLVTQISLMTQIFLRGDYFVPQISQIYTDFLHHDFSSSDFTDESEAFLLIGLLTDFRGILAAGQWLAPYICSCCFGHADFTDIHRFFMESLVNLFVQSQGVSATTGQVASAKIRE